MGDDPWSTVTGPFEDFADWATRSDEAPASTQVGTIDRDTLEAYYEENPEAQEHYEIQPEELEDQEAGDVQSINLGDDGGTTTWNFPDEAEDAAQDAADAAGDAASSAMPDLSTQQKAALAGAGLLLMLAIARPYANLGAEVAG